MEYVGYTWIVLNPSSMLRRFAQEFPQAGLEAVPRAGHIPMENNPEMVGASLVGFFAEEYL
jgi:hypothetical protein